jgi:hypothetical protein
MATGRIGTTPVLQVRWSKAPSDGTTSLSGLDDNSVSLVYSVGYEAVYRNGVLLSRGNDYTATDGTTVTLIDATITGDIIEIFANQTIPLSDTYSQTVSDGKFINNTLTTTTGDIIYASGANTPARLAIGTSADVLTVSGGVPAWAAPASGSMTQLATGTLSGTSTSISSIPGSYKDLRLVIYDFYATAIEQIQIRINGDNTTNYLQNPNQTSGASVSLTTRMLLSQDIMNGVADGIAVLDFYDYAATTHWKSANALFNSKYDAGTAYQNVNSRGAWISTAAITSIQINTVNGNSWTNGTYILYGVN